MYSKEYYNSHKENYKKYNLKYYKTNKEKINTQNKKYRIINSDKYKAYESSYTRRFNKTQQSAEKRNIEFLLSLDEFVNKISQPCYYCNNNLCEKSKTGIGLDRLDNSKGYVNDNIVSCGKICNLIKNKFLSSEETLAAVNAILMVRGKLK